MPVINIRKAQRSGARLVISLAGISGSGKTRTALELAYGLAGYHAGKVGLLDAENKRGSLYSDCLRNEKGETQQFMVGDLEPPFSPKRYAEAIREFQRAGARVLVIDSTSHEWEGTGGCEEIAHAQNPRLPDWATAKREHKEFMNVLLQSDMDIIACVRAREKVKISKVGGKTTVESIGIQPISEKNFMFEMTASLMMWNEGKAQEVIKCPEELRGILGRETGYITAADGAALRAWVDGAAPVNPEIERAHNSLRMATQGGVSAYRAAWALHSKAIRDALQADGTHDALKRAAEDYDEIKVDARPGGADLAGLNAAIKGGEQHG